MARWPAPSSATATLVPGWALHGNCEPKRPTEPSIDVNGNVGCLTIDHSITGAIEVNRDQVQTDPVHIRDPRHDRRRHQHASASRHLGPGMPLRPRDARGRAQHDLRTSAGPAIELAENSILAGIDPRLPPPARLHPLLLRGRRDRARRAATSASPISSKRRSPTRFAERRDHRRRTRRAARARARAGRARIQQHALRRSDLRRSWPTPAPRRSRRGAEDQSEMGAFHDLYQPQRAANLRARLAEFAPAGVETMVVFAT